MPNAGHEALAELERRGLLEGVITQNIDRLHRAAGSRNVVEVHGSIATSSCRSCAASYGIEEVDALFDESGVAICAACGGPVKPDVVLFGELLPEGAMSEAPRSSRRRADLMLCIGSSLVVYPVAGLPRRHPRLSGGRLAIVTKGPTPYDGDAALKLEGEVDAELERAPGGAGVSADGSADGRARRRSSSTTTACCSTPSRSGRGPSRISSSGGGSSSPRRTSASWSGPRPRSPAASSSGGSASPAGPRS